MLFNLEKVESRMKLHEAFRRCNIFLHLFVDELENNGSVVSLRWAAVYVSDESLSSSPSITLFRLFWFEVHCKVGPRKAKTPFSMSKYWNCSSQSQIEIIMVINKISIRNFVILHLFRKKFGTRLSMWKRGMQTIYGRMYMVWKDIGINIGIDYKNQNTGLYGMLGWVNVHFFAMSNRVNWKNEMKIFSFVSCVLEKIWVFYHIERPRNCIERHW